MAWTVCTFHAPHSFGHGFLLGVDSVVEGPDPVISEILGWYSFEFDFIVMPELLSGLSVDDLRVVEMWSGGEDFFDNLWRVFGEAKALEGCVDEFG